MGAALVATGADPAWGGPVIVAGGDIACPDSPCDSHRRTARLIGGIEPRAVLTLGDNQYDEGALADFRASYDPTWGRYLRRTFPSPGNHEYRTAGAEGYFDYFGRRARRAAGGLYSFDLGAWHLVSINTGNGPPTISELRWIRRDLRTSEGRCQLAYWHHPRWSSGTRHGSDDRLEPLWRTLFRRGVDVVLNGHEHNYERFAPIDPAGNRSRHGIRQFVVGTGGRGHYPLGSPIEGSQVGIDDRFGVIQLELKRRGYEWRFVATNPREVLDRGRGRCHR